MDDLKKIPSTLWKPGKIQFKKGKILNATEKFILTSLPAYNETYNV